MKRYGNLENQILSWDNLVQAYKLAAKGKKSRRAIKRFYNDFDNNLAKIQHALRTRQFTTSAYREKTIFEPKKRTIYVLPFPDRIVHHALMNICEPIIDKRFYEYSLSCRPGKGIHKGLKYVQDKIRANNYAWKFDVSKFYPSINHDLVYGQVCSVFKDPFVLWLFKDIIYSIDGETNMPIGNYVSQWLGNLYLNGLDIFIKEELKIRDYVRYCDDFIIFSKTPIDEEGIVNRIIDFLWDKLKLLPSQSYGIDLAGGEPIDFLGYKVYKDGRTQLRDTSKKRFKNHVKFLYYALHHKVMSLDYIRSSLYSMHGWIKYTKFDTLGPMTTLYKLEDELHIAERYGVDTLNRVRGSDKYDYDPKTGLYLSRDLEKNRKLLRHINWFASDKRKIPINYR